MKKYFFFIAFITLFSCETRTSYSEFKNDFEDNRWFPSNEQIFEFHIEEDNLTYDIKMQLGHIYDYDFESVPFKIEIQSPDGKIELLRNVVQIKGKNGKDLGQCTGDICDVFTTIKKDVKLNMGDYKISIKPDVNLPYLPNILGVGFRLEKVTQ